MLGLINTVHTIVKYKQRSTVYKQVTESQLTNNRRIELPVTNVLF